MVVFIDLESDDDEPCRCVASSGEQTRAMMPAGLAAAALPEEGKAADNSERLSGPAAFSAALTCYPVALALASHIDLNDLHALSLTCHSIRNSLVQYAPRLVASSLRCSFDSLPLLADLLHAQFDIAEPDHDSLPSTPGTPAPARPPAAVAVGPLVARSAVAVSTKTFPCARDLVAACQKCGTVVCRNCATKAPSDRYLTERHRRLCRKCLDAPLIAHLQPLRGVDELPVHDPAPMSSASSAGSALSSAGSSILLDDVDSASCDSNAFTSKAFLRGPCLCASRGSYLCAGCGHNLRTNDTMHSRAWTWRSRYSTHIGGGIGTGLGLGDQGQKCGRGQYCLETGPEGVSWVELDCCSGGDEHEAWASSLSGTLMALGDRPSSSPQSKRPGYFQQEIEGIGGVVKTKVRKRVKVGATVYEYEDERRTGKYLERESSGRERSWCGWCGRVCLGEKDRQDQAVDYGIMTAVRVDYYNGSQVPVDYYDGSPSRLSLPYSTVISSSRINIVPRTRLFAWMNLPDAPARRRSSSLDRPDPYSSPSVYYDNEDAIRKQLLGPNNRTVSSYINRGRRSFSPAQGPYPQRRTSHDEYLEQDQELLIDVQRTLKDLIEQEDVDGDQQITIDDHGPKHIALGTFASAGYRSTEVRGNYMISNLLQELTLAQDLGKKVVKLHRSRLNENPVDRLSRRIRDEFWKNLERCLDANSIEKAGKDPKSWADDDRPRIYVPHGCPEQYDYYTRVARDQPEMGLDVRWLPQDGLDARYVRGLNGAPGILALAMTKTIVNGKEVLKGEPFVVPGGRFNELYGWDTYMESLGLIENGRVGLAKSMVINFIFCIQHYGKILNANRSYYLCRSQPPFLTDMVLRVYDKIKQDEGALDFLRNGIRAAIKEYYNVWTAEPRYDPVTGLSRYRPAGLGIPPETEASHFVHIITPYAKSGGLTFAEYVRAYNNDEIDEPELDEYFLHDRAVRESGHDTSYRLEGCAANLATIDLNALLYKYEIDIAWCIRHFFKDGLTIPPEFQTEANRLDGVEKSATWDRRAKLRKARVDKYMWDEKAGMYFDYDTVKKKRTTYESATTFWAMWAGLSSPRQAASLVLNALPKFEVFGGLVSGTQESRGRIGLDRPTRQWDYPFGWAPQQILAWGGLIRYGYSDEAQRLAYKWLYMVTKAFVDFNGVVVEKYNVTRELDPHKVEAEYGNQGM
ncbi:hypothetical protein DV736_g4819, partial [Chaetothyriales sp. CBS 134916]